MRICNCIRFRIVTQLLYFNFVDNMPSIRSYRSSAFQFAFNSLNRFVADILFFCYPSQTLKKYSERMGTALIHESSRHHHVVHEMTG